MIKNLPFTFYFLLSISSCFCYIPLCAQQIQWQKTLGGKQGDYLYDALPTPDYGFILAGSSVSEISGIKTEENRGNLDYFLWKMNEQGQEEWQKSLGGNQADFLYSIGLTRDGGYILGGSSYSGISGDKKDSCRGQDDYWIIKLNAAGQEEWQKTIGGSGSDHLLSIQQTSDGGYILGGSSDSPVSYEKTAPSKGSMDFWIIKLDAKGKILWQKTLGGLYYDLLGSIKEIPEGYILAGTSHSPKSEDKSEDNLGKGDYWLLKLDKNGKLLWEKTLGGKKNEELHDMIVASDGGYILAGSSDSPQEGMKISPQGKGLDFWIVKTDKNGTILWQQSIDIGTQDIVSKIVENKDNSFSVAGSSLEITPKGETESNYILVRLSPKGEILAKQKIGGDKKDILQTAVDTRDGTLLMAGTSNSGKSGNKTVENTGQTDFWLVKLYEENNDYITQNSLYKRKNAEVYPNPTERFVNVIIYEELTGKENIEIYDISGKLLQQKTVKYSTTPIDLTGYPPAIYILSISLPSGKKESIKIIKTGK